ncbi:MAG: N-6 DNA methylase [Clostridia bacterium]|nr:N-6 DNA methylase [Clostridia bacterium]
MKYTKQGETLLKELNNNIDNKDEFSCLYAIQAVFEKQQKNNDKQVAGLEKSLIEQYAQTYSLVDIQNACELFFEHYFQSIAPGHEKTPKGIAHLAAKLLDINAKDSLADFGSGFGDFLIEAKETEKMFGIEIVDLLCEVSRIRAEILGKKITFINDSVFNAKRNEYDKIFVNCPFGMRAKYIFGNASQNYENKLYNNATSGDWLYALKALEALKKGGKAVSIVTTGSLINKPDSLIREHLIKEGKIESVILLPERLFSTTAIQTALIIFSDNNSKIRFVDASKCCKKERRMNILDEESIEQIIKLSNGDFDVSKTIPVAEVDSDTFILEPKKYLIEEYYADNEEALGDFVQIRRAGRFSASDLDEYIVEEKTPYKCLTIANAQEWMVGGDYSSFKEMPPKSDKLVVKQNNIILARAGSPDFKASLFIEVAGQTMIANGNFYIIEVNEEKLNPYFLLAFLNSPLAQKRLAAAATGAAIKILPTEAIKALRIPIHSMNEQNRIGSEVKDKLKRIAKHKQIIAELHSDLEKITETDA